MIFTDIHPVPLEFNMAHFLNQECLTLGFIETIRPCCQQVMLQLPVSKQEESTVCLESKYAAFAYTPHLASGREYHCKGCIPAVGTATSCQESLLFDWLFLGM